MIALDVAGGIATVTLDRPAARNALPTAGWRALADLFARVPADAAALVVASSTPGVFSAGADLADLARLVDDVPARTAFRQAMQDAVEALAALPMPTVAAVGGAAFGAGVALALACDVIVAGADARFSIPPARLGIGYPAGDVARLIARVGKGQAARLLFTAAPVDAAEALRIGLADLSGDGVDVARTIAANDADALRLLKNTLRSPHDSSLSAAFEASFGSPAFANGVARYRRTS
ncbi:enoyl-CoA hydratase/isomerase family protein [uncultured Sphingomonas sp.]|jgi:enoyl-CoA hydratase/carnithine racemase|uniref:enoyl-CoA hydratase/isomerase family protein n=1 Tax=uncultured Sphingomonas sp. TaxID=158754 RepID=UPI0030DDCDFD